MVAFLDHLVLGDDAGSVAVVDVGGKKKTLSSGWSSADGVAWSQDGNEVWFTAAEVGTSRALYAVTVEGTQRLVARVTGGLTLWDIFHDGSLLISHETSRSSIVGLPPGADRERDLSWLDWSHPADLSLDGKIVLFDEEGDGGGPDYSVCLRKTDGSPAVLLGEGEAMSLSPDSKWALASNTHRLPEQLILLPTGVGEPKTLTHDAINHNWAWWFPDGKQILFDGNEPGHARRTYIFRCR